MVYYIMCYVFLLEISKNYMIFFMLYLFSKLFLLLLFFKLSTKNFFFFGDKYKISTI